MTTLKRALIIVDVQNDFCEGGSLAVEGGAQVAKRITEFVRRVQDHSMSEHIRRYDAIVATRDWHLSPGEHFASTVGQDPDFLNTWPDHCVAGTAGAEFHPDLKVAPDCLIYKGMTSAAYSGFEGIYTQDHYIDKRPATLEFFLNQADITAVDVVGLAFDYCVFKTAQDAARLGFDTTVITSLTAAVHPIEIGYATKILERAGVTVVDRVA